jgi:hypothetical protein
MLKTLIYIIILALGFPTGLVLARFCREEIKNWRKRFLIISIICLILAIITAFLDFIYRIPVIIALIFIIIVLLTIIWKSHKKH